MRKLKRRRMFWFSITIIVLCGIGVFFAPNNPDIINLAYRLCEPSSVYPFGTDLQGRCLLSRILYGAQTSMSIVFLSFIITMLIGCPLGLYLSIMKNNIKWITDSTLNAISALPPIVYLMIFIGAWGNGILTTFVAIIAGILPMLIKFVKSKAELEMGKAYVLSAKVSGCKTFRLLFRHIFPNSVREIISYMSLQCAQMIMLITSFSFIGLGPGDTVKDLGGIIQEAYQVVLIRPDIMVYPVVVVGIISLSFNLLGQEVR